MPITILSRRAVLKSSIAVAGAGLTTFLSAQSSRPRRVFALIGDRYHNSDYIHVALSRMFEGQNVTVDYTTDVDSLSAATLGRCQLFVCLRDGMIWPDGCLGPDAYTAYASSLENGKDFPDAKSQTWLKEEQAVALKSFVDAGNGFYSLHNNSHVSLSSKTWRDVQGGAYIGHPPLRPFRVRVVNESHPVTKGIRDFVVNDEQHYVSYDKEKGHILLEAENVDGLTFQNLGAKSVAGWAYEYGRGRVVFTSPGHTIHALWAPEYLKLQRQAVQWLLKTI